MRLLIHAVVVASLLAMVPFYDGVAQDAGSHAEVVAKIKASLEKSKGEELAKRMVTLYEHVSDEAISILDSTTEADLGAQLFNYFAAEVKKFETFVGTLDLNHPENFKSKASDFERCFYSLAAKAELLQFYYDALPEKAQAAWKNGAAAKIAGITAPLVGQLKNKGFVRPATQIAFYRQTCFFGTKELAKAFEELKANESFINETGKILADAGFEGVQKDTPFYPQLEQGINQILSGSPDVAKLLPLLKILAASVDYAIDAKRKELASKVIVVTEKKTAAENTTPNTDKPTEDGELRPAPVAVKTVQKPNINFVVMLPLPMRVEMAKNLKLLVSKNDDANYETLLRAWLAMSQSDGFEDVFFPALKFDEDAFEEGDIDKIFKKAAKGCEALSVFPDYQRDLRLLSVLTDVFTVLPEQAFQAVCNLGEPMLPFLAPLVSVKTLHPTRKVFFAKTVEAIGKPDSALILMPLLLSDEAEVVAAAQNAIGRLGDRRASAMLVKGLGNPKVAETVKNTLKKMGPGIQADVISQFREGKPLADKVAVEILQEVGDVRALTALAALLQRYHSSSVTESLSQAEKTEVIKHTLQAATSIISRNIGKTAPDLSAVASTSTTSPSEPGMPPSYDDYSDTSHPGGAEDGMASAPKKVVVTKMSAKEVGTAPYVWLEAVYLLSFRHLEATSKIMAGIKSISNAERSGKELKDRVNSETFRQALNTSEEGLEVYLSDNDIRKLSENKTRVKRSFARIKSEEERIGKSEEISERLGEIITGIPRATTPGEETGTGSGRKEPPRRSLGDRF